MRPIPIASPNQSKLALYFHDECMLLFCMRTLTIQKFVVPLSVDNWAWYDERTLVLAHFLTTEMPKITLFDIETREETTLVKGDDIDTSNVQIREGYAYYNNRKTIERVDCRTKTVYQMLESEFYFRHFEVCPQNMRVCANECMQRSTILSVWDLQTGNRLAVLSDNISAYCGFFKWNCSGTRLCAMLSVTPDAVHQQTSRNKIVLWDTATEGYPILHSQKSAFKTSNFTKWRNNLQPYIKWSPCDSLIAISNDHSTTFFDASTLKIHSQLVNFAPLEWVDDYRGTFVALHIADKSPGQYQMGFFADLHSYQCKRLLMAIWGGVLLSPESNDPSFLRALVGFFKQNPGLVSYIGSKIVAMMRFRYIKPPPVDDERSVSFSNLFL